MGVLQQTEQTLRFRPLAPSYVFDEVFDGQGRPRSNWSSFIEAARQVTLEELRHRTNQAEEQLRENGVTFNVFHEGTQLQRPWRLDLVPVILGAEEWRGLERGLAQRARLLQAILRDCYGSRQMLAKKLLPPEVLFGNPGFVRAFVGLHGEKGPMISLYGAELARSPRGDWFVMADRAEAPAGLAFALENRIVSTRSIPAALHREPVQRLAPFFVQLQEILRQLGSQQAENPRVVLLSAGAKSPYYFEDVYLARYMGYSLVEGADLAVRDDRVYLKTLAGLIGIDVILTRGPERGLDPLELGGNAPHGVPGLLHAVRKGNVVVANPPGSALVESPIFMAFLPQLCQVILGESLLLPSISTWWCGDPAQREEVWARFTELVIKPAFQASGGEETVVGRLSADARATLRAEINAHPHLYVAQELIARSAVPSYRDGRMQAGHVALRSYLVASGPDNFAMMPGGLVRIAATSDPMELSVSAGIGSKDLWVLADGPVKPVSLLNHEDKLVPLRRTSAVFPSRVADDLFWLGQSLDRADFLSRLLRSLAERLAAETAPEAAEMPALIRALADQGVIEPGFAIGLLSQQLPALEESLPRMVADPREIRGLSAATAELQRLASLERLWMSPDTWRQIHEAVGAFQDSATSGWTGLVDLLEAVNQLILGLAAVSGLIHDGMIRSPAWRLLDIGRRIERARDVVHLLRSVLGEYGHTDRAVLKTILEVIDCRMTYRARYLDNFQLNAVLDLCITDESCPRSVASQLVALADHVEALPHDLSNPLRTEEKRAVMVALHAVRMIAPEQLEREPPNEIMENLVLVETQMRLLSEILTRKYLLHSGTPRQFVVEVQLPQ